MENIFLKLLNMSITASYLVLAVLLARILLKKAPKFITVILWGLVAVRLLCPFSIESFLSLIPSAETVPSDIMYAKTPQIYSGIPQINTSVNNIIMPQFYPNLAYSANPLQIVTFIASIVWLIGIVVMILYTAISYVNIYLKVREAVKLQENIYVCDRITTPFILGVIKPKIYLPSSMQDTDSEFVIAHEKSHIKRRDYLWKPLGFLLLTIYWFNPILWIAYILLCRDIELACDESVIKQMGEDIKKPYSHALINCSLNRRTIMACPLAFGEVNIKNRIKSVLNYKKPAFWIIITAVVLSMIIAVCFLTNPAGFKINELNDKGDYSNIFNNVDGITVTRGEEQFIITNEDSIKQIITALQTVKLRNDPISENRSEDRDMTNRITINGNILCFSKDFTEFWILNGVKPTLSYKVTQPLMAEKAFWIKDNDYTTAITSDFSSGTDIYGLTVTVKDIVLNNYNPYIEVEYKNETDKEYIFGDDFDICYKKDGTYQSCATRILIFNSIGYPIAPKQSRTNKYLLSDFDLSRDGSYRFITDMIYTTGDGYSRYNLWIDFELQNQTDVEMYLSKDESATQVVKIKQLKEEYPQYFDLPTVNGLEVYAVPLTVNLNFPSSISCYLFSGNNLGYEYGDLDPETSVTDDEMKLILSTYKDIASNEINIVAFNNPSTMYYIETDDAYISELRTKFNIYNKSLDSYPHFKATVLEVNEDGNILVEAFQNENIRNISTQFTLNVADVYKDAKRPIKPGDKLRIAYNGSVQKANPANIEDIRTVILIDGGIY